MSTAPSPRDFAREPPENGGSAEQRYAQLRHILVGPEQARLDELQRRLDDPQLRAEDLSQVVAEAIALRARQDRALQLALNPVIEEAVRISVSRDPKMLAQVLFPIVGSAVRKSVAHAFRGMVESLNHTLERSFSLEALTWRLEALRTGKPFGEIVLTRSLRYRVEQVFLIHRENGLLLQYVCRPGQAAQESDLVAAMLTAVQDFVRDSFAEAGGQELETVELGEFNLWIAHGPAALLAAVVSGSPPPELRDRLQQTLEEIHQEFAPVLAAYDGNTEALSGARPRLEACLLGKQPQTPARRSQLRAVVALVLLLLLLGTGTFFWLRERYRWNTLVERLRSEPGIILAGADNSWSGYRLAGLRDPLSVDPERLIGESGLDPARFITRWEPYVSLAPEFTTQRRFLEEEQALEQQVVRFKLASSELTPEQAAKLDEIETHILKLQEYGAATGQRFTVEVYGHTDPLGKEEKNELLSQERAQSVVDGLVDRGFSRDLFRAEGVASSQPVRRSSYLSELNRRVTFQVVAAAESRP